MLNVFKWKGGAKKEKKRKNKNKIQGPQPQNDIMDHTRHGQHWLTALPTPYTESLQERTAFILAYCISLYVSAGGPFMCIHTGKRTFQLNSQWI